MTIEVLKGVSLADAEVLAPYWQTRPVVLRAAVSATALTPEPNTLCDIITQTDLPSRLITGAEGGRFTLTRGPFEHFEPPKGPWTVLIQALEHFFPEYDQLRQQLNWLPSWRFEDCMLSWASAGGSVGRHFDQFDVFLVQLSGRREWALGPQADADTPLQPNQPLALVHDQPADRIVTVEPGDVVYLPPRWIHHGVALDADCMTLSIGFRAPDVGQLLESLLEQMDDDVAWHRYQDPKPGPRQGPAEITELDLDRVRTVIAEYLNDSERLASAFARRVTEPYLEDSEPEAEAFGELATDSADHWVLDAGCRMAYFQSKLFINGEWIGDQAPDALYRLANQRWIDSPTIRSLADPWRTRIQHLIDCGQLAPAEDGD